MCICMFVDMYVCVYLRILRTGMCVHMYVRMYVCRYVRMCVCMYVRGGADKSLARPGRKQATAIKLGIYSTYSHEAQYTS